MLIEVYLLFRYCEMNECIDDLIIDPLIMHPEDVKLSTHFNFPHMFVLFPLFTI